MHEHLTHHQYQQIECMLLDAITHRPKSIVLNYLIAWLYNHVGFTAQALQYLQLIIHSQSPDYVQTLLAWLYMKSEKFLHAARLYHLLCYRKPHNSDLTFLAAYSLEKANLVTPSTFFYNKYLFEKPVKQAMLNYANKKFVN